MVIDWKLPPPDLLSVVGEPTRLFEKQKQKNGLQPKLVATIRFLKLTKTKINKNSFKVKIFDHKDSTGDYVSCINTGWIHTRDSFFDDVVYGDAFAWNLK